MADSAIFNETIANETESINSSALSMEDSFYQSTGLPYWIFSFVAYWELMVSIIGTPMNIFVIFIWATLSLRSSNRRFNVQSKNRWFILSMSTGDLLFTSVHAPMMYAWYSETVEMTDGPCYITYGSTHLSTTVSSISLLLLNVDKFIYLHWPLHYHSMMTTKRAIMLTIATWIISINWMLLFLFGPFMKRGENCDWKTQYREFYVAFLFVFFLMPILLSTATSLYIAIVAVRASILEAASQAAYVNGSTSTNGCSPMQAIVDDCNSAAQLNGHRNMPLTSPAVKPWRTITFVFTTTIWSTITYLPYRIAFIIFTATGGIQLAWHYPLFALMVIYAAGNPFITILTQPPYRRRALEMFESLRNLVKRSVIRSEKL